MINYLLGLKHSPFSLKPNKVKIPVTALYPSDLTIEEFNKLYEWVRNTYINKIFRTQSGGISVSRLHFKPPMWDISSTQSCVELTLILYEGFWRIQIRFGSSPDEEKKIASGRQAFLKFKEMAKKYNIDMKNYEIENGPEVKKEIEKSLIKLENKNISGLIWNNVHHIDIHSCYCWSCGFSDW